MYVGGPPDGSGGGLVSPPSGGGGLTAKLLAAKKRFDVGDINARQLAEQKSEIMRAALMGM